MQLDHFTEIGATYLEPGEFPRNKISREHNVYVWDDISEPHDVGSRWFMYKGTEYLDTVKLIEACDLTDLPLMYTQPRYRFFKHYITKRLKGDPRVVIEATKGK